VTRRGTLAQTGSGSIALLAVGLVVFNLGATLLVASRKSTEAHI
jgi:LPXTG-motif cell wall-anchored protein